MAKQHVVERSIREHARGGAKGELARIRFHTEREYLKVVLQVLAGAERSLYRSALIVVADTAIVAPENVPPGMVARVAELMGERETREAGYRALKNLILRNATSAAHEDMIFRAERRRLATIFEDLQARQSAERLGQELVNV
jgi:hypothetical protein